MSVTIPQPLTTAKPGEVPSRPIEWRCTVAYDNGHTDHATVTARLWDAARREAAAILGAPVERVECVAVHGEAETAVVSGFPRVVVGLSKQKRARAGRRTRR